MRTARTIRISAVAMAIGVVLSLCVPPVSATDRAAPAAAHCVVGVQGRQGDGEFVLSPPACFTRFDEAMASAGLGGGIEGPDEARQALAKASTTIGIHYDAAGFTGPSLSIVGVDCAGGYVNMPAAWDNRVSSSISNFCGRLRHFSGAGRSGTSQDTLPNGNLIAPVNNSVSSIQYLT